MATVIICSDFGASPNESLSVFPLFPHLFAMKWWDQMPWSSFYECWALSQLFHSSFTFIKRLFSSSSLSVIRVVSCVYLRLLIFVLAILIPACASSSLAFCMMYSAYKLNKQGDNIQPWCTRFPIWNKSVVPCPVLTVASWPAYRFLRRQVRWSGIPISLRIFHSFFVIRTSQDFGIVSEVDYVWITTQCGRFLKRWEYQTTWPVSCEICMQVKKQQLQLGMEQ